MAVDLNNLIKSLSQRQQATESQLNELAGVIKALEARLCPTATDAEKGAENHVTPEMLVVIAAAVTAYLGKKVRIRSAKLLRAQHAVANQWSQQGRMIIHASHNLRLKG